MDNTVPTTRTDATPRTGDEALAAAAPPPRPSTGATMRTALVWNGANLIANQVVGAVIFFILARELAPAVFGVLALALIYTDFFTQQGASAIRDALVQRQDFSRASLSTMFWLALAVAAAASAAGCIAAPHAAAAFHAPQLSQVLPALSLSILLAPPTAVMEAQLMRHLQFKALAIRNMTAVWVAGAAGLAVVFSPYAEWALVVQRLTQMAFSAIFLFVRTRWTPGLAFDRPLARAYAKASSQLWSMQVISVSGLQFVDAMIGWRLGPTTLGMARVARKFIEIVHASVTAAVMSMWVPLMSRVAHDSAQRSEMFLKLMQFAALICMPPMIGLSLVGPELAGAVLADSYWETGVALSIMGLSGVYIPLTYFRSAVLTALSRNGLSLKIAVADLAFICACVFWFSQYGLEAALLSVTFGALATTSVSAYFTCRAVGVPLRTYLRALAPSYFALLAMTIAVVGLSLLLGGWPNWARLVVKTIVGALAYLGYLYVFHRAWLMSNVRFVMERH